MRQNSARQLRRALGECVPLNNAAEPNLCDRSVLTDAAFDDDVSLQPRHACNRNGMGVAWIPTKRWNA